MLLSAAGSMRFWLYTAPADMRKGFDGLADLVPNRLGNDPLRGDVFVFISRSRVQIKLLEWDGDGYVLFSKRLERGHFDFGWLKTYHTFSIGQHHDPSRMNFGALRVLNEDTVAAGEGFGTHPHRNMEIIVMATALSSSR